MRTAHLPTVHVPVADTRCQYHGGVGHQVNKLQQVSSDDNHMPVAGRVGGGLNLCLVSRGQGGRSHVWY